MNDVNDNYKKYGIQEAVGVETKHLQTLGEGIFKDICEVDGFGVEHSASENTDALNKTICEISKCGGGTVFIPKGEYRLYTVVLKSNVLLKLDDEARIYAAVQQPPNADNKNPAIVEQLQDSEDYGYRPGTGDGGYFLKPEVFLYAGIQDHGHSYFANSLFYAEDECNVGIEGGSIFGYVEDSRTGDKTYTLFGTDPSEPNDRLKEGCGTFWYANKCIAIKNCTGVKIEKVNVVIGGHFAIICTGVTNLWLENLLVDTNRDAIDIDCCENVTVRNVKTNSLTDDGIVLKASFGAGRYQKCRNVLIENCTVTGFDAGSVFNQTYTTNKKAAEDLDGPTGRIKLGTESTCGFERVTVRHTRFIRSRGFAIESVDGAEIRDVIFEDCIMENVSSSPIFIIASDRGRSPVTGISKSTSYPPKSDARLDNPQWVIPNCEGFHRMIAQRYTPSINRDLTIHMNDKDFTIVNPNNPLNINENNFFTNERGESYPLIYENGEYVRKENGMPISQKDMYMMANANGSSKLASIEGVLIRNVKATDVDSRYPIIIVGMVDSVIKKVFLENIEVSMKGGLAWKEAVEERVVSATNCYEKLDKTKVVQQMHLMVNPFFAKNEALLQRKSYDSESGVFYDNPYNVPELTNIYPEPSAYGILPAFGMYIRHAERIIAKNISISTKKYDERLAIVLDDVTEIKLDDTYIENQDKMHKGKGSIGLITNHYKRHTNREYLLNEPYHTTQVTGITVDSDSDDGLTIKDCINISVDSPAPGTPTDQEYGFPTVAEMYS